MVFDKESLQIIPIISKKITLKLDEAFEVMILSKPGFRQLNFRQSPEEFWYQFEPNQPSATTGSINWISDQGFSRNNEFYGTFIDDKETITCKFIFDASENTLSIPTKTGKRAVYAHAQGPVIDKATRSTVLQFMKHPDPRLTTTSYDGTVFQDNVSKSTISILLDELNAEKLKRMLNEAKVDVINLEETVMVEGQAKPFDIKCAQDGYYHVAVMLFSRTGENTHRYKTKGKVKIENGLGKLRIKIGKNYENMEITFGDQEEKEEVKINTNYQREILVYARVIVTEEDIIILPVYGRNQMSNPLTKPSDEMM